MSNENRTTTEQLRDTHGSIFNHVVARGVPLSRYVMANIDISREVTLNSATRIISVCALDKDIYMRWGAGVVTTSGSEKFDEIIPAGTVREFAVPDKINGQLHTTVNFMERAATAVLIMVEK